MPFRSLSVPGRSLSFLAFSVLLNVSIMLPQNTLIGRGRPGVFLPMRNAVETLGLGT